MAPSTTGLAARRAAFRALHQEGCFVMPNPWDSGSARYLRSLGFQALGTTSAGFAFSEGLPDNAVTIERALAHCTEIVEATALPVHADFQGGYGHDPEDVARNVSRCVATGVAGLSIEDATGDRGKPLYEMGLAVDRIRAARDAIDAVGGQVLLTARAECFLVGHTNPLEESIRRLRAYSEAGADVLFAPGPRDVESIRAIVEGVQPTPVNCLIGSDVGLRVSEVAALGVRRISVGSALARAAWTGFLRAAKELAGQGSFSGFAGLLSFSELNQFFLEDFGKQ